MTGSSVFWISFIPPHAPVSQPPAIEMELPPEVRGFVAGDVTVGLLGAALSRIIVADILSDQMPLVVFCCRTLNV